MDCLGFNDAIQMRNASEMTPAELAHVNGHFELANKLHSLHVQVYKEWNQQHVYDYIHQNNYQIPPPPRPVHEKPKNDDPFGTLKAAKVWPILVFIGIPSRLTINENDSYFLSNISVKIMF